MLPPAILSSLIRLSRSRCKFGGSGRVTNRFVEAASFRTSRRERVEGGGIRAVRQFDRTGGKLQGFSAVAIPVGRSRGKGEAQRGERFRPVGAQLIRPAQTGDGAGKIFFRRKHDAHLVVSLGERWLKSQRGRDFVEREFGPTNMP